LTLRKVIVGSNFQKNDFFSEHTKARIVFF
jgi:hypothetical protein